MTSHQAPPIHPHLDFRAIFEASPNPYMLLDRELRYVAANPAYLKVTASRLEDLLGRNIFDAFPHDPTDPQNLNALMLRRSFERVIATGKADVLALIAYRVPIEIDGQPVLKERYWSATHTPLFDEAGKVAYVLQHTVDVTEVQELKRVVREAGLPADPSQIEAGVLTRARHVQETNSTLMAETGHLRRLFEQAPGFMCFLRGPEHRYEMANAAYVQLIGGRNVIGQSVQEALPELAGQGFYELLDRVYTTNTPFIGSGVPVVLKRRPETGPEEAFLDFIYQPITAPTGEVVGIFVQGHDVTEQKRFEAERELRLRQEQEARLALQQRAEFEQQLIGIVSHDLRNPVAAILLSAQAMLRREVADSRILKGLARVQLSAERANRMIRDLLDFTEARLGGSGFKLHRRSASLREIVSGVVDELQVTEDHELLLDAPTEGRGEWDPDRLGQLATNLITNAIKYGAPGTPVRITLRETEREVELVVTNEGTPIPAEKLHRIFEPLQRAVEGMDKSTRSIGLGLYIVDQIARSHGGTIEVRSTQAEGTSFLVRLPKDRPPEA